MSDSLALFFDTETSDKWDFKAAWNAPHQPYLVQLGFKVRDLHSRAVIIESGFLVDSTRLGNWKGMSPGAEAVNKISEKVIRQYGVAPEQAMERFQFWGSLCSLWVAHNVEFDLNIMRCHAQRTGFSPELNPAAQLYCTMKSTTNLLKIPSDRGGYKWPKLSEAYARIVDTRGFKDGHNALADVNACDEIFWALVDNGYIPIAPKETEAPNDQLQ